MWIPANLCLSVFPLRYSFCDARIPMWQLMEAGMSGANGQCAAASVRSRGVENATPRYPDIEAKCAKGTVRPLRTAQMDSAPRVRPFSLLFIIIIILIFSPNIIIIIYTLTVTWQVITSMLEQEAGTSWKRNHTVDSHRFPENDNVSTLSFVYCSLDILFAMSHSLDTKRRHLF